MKFSTPKDGISKWYTIFAVFLALNFCGLSYVYYLKYYKNPKTTGNSKQDDSLTANVIVLPADTIYVDKDEMDSLKEDEAESETEQVAESSLVNKTKETTDASNAVAIKQNTQVNKTESAIKPDISGDNKSIASVAKKPALEKGIGKTEDEGHTFLVSLGMFKTKSNALSFMADLKQKGIEGEIVESDHFSKMAPGFILVLAGKELSSATAYQIGADMKKKGLDNFVKDAGKFSWR